MRRLLLVLLLVVACGGPVPVTPSEPKTPTPETASASFEPVA